jgi:hypothetical protein
MNKHSSILGIPLALVAGILSSPLHAHAGPTNLAALAEASLAANVRKDHPHGIGDTTSPAVRPGNAFTQGIPGYDIQQTALYSIGSITGESGGFDIFNAVNPGDERT